MAVDNGVSWCADAAEAEAHTLPLPRRPGEHVGLTILAAAAADDAAAALYLCLLLLLLSASVCCCCCSLPLFAAAAAAVAPSSQIAYVCVCCARSLSDMFRNVLDNVQKEAKERSTAADGAIALVSPCVCACVCACVCVCVCLRVRFCVILWSLMLVP
jgi:hypothetical protein